MKILVVCQYYHPEPFRISDICEEMVRRGHSVTVVTGVPNYPEGVTYPGYEKRQNRYQELGGVKVHRCFTIPRKTGIVYRMLNYYSYAFSSARYVKKLPDDFDVVLVYQLSPVMMAQAAITYCRKYRKPLMMYCLDLWPESLIAGGIRRGSAIYRLFHHISGRIYSRMDEILVTSRMFCDYLEEQFGIPQRKIKYLPQYADDVFDVLPTERQKENFHFTFAGNIGELQNVEVLLQAAELLEEEPVTFHIVGGGTDLERMQRLAREKRLDNVVFYGRRPLEEMPRFYRMSDAMLITLKADPVLSYTLPGKIQSYMAAGKPIIGAINGETAQVVAEARCGFCGEAENPLMLAENVKRFVSCEDRARLGRNARAYYARYFEKQSFMDMLERELEALRDQAYENSCV